RALHPRHRREIGYQAQHRAQAPNHHPRQTRRQVPFTGDCGRAWPRRAGRRSGSRVRATTLRSATKPLPPMKVGWFARLLARWSESIARQLGWQSLPRLAGAVTLFGLRTQLRQHNLYDTGLLPVKEPANPPGEDPRLKRARGTDGRYNDMDFPNMGRAGTRFGRNVPLGRTLVELDNVLRPNPREVSLRLLSRDRFIPAPTLNLLAACWLQFMVHDWLQHGKNQRSDPWAVPLAADDTWPDHPMQIPRTR